MANSMSGIKVFTRAIIDAKPWKKDPLVLRKEWSQSEYSLQNHGGGKGLCFAIMWDNGVVRPHPPLQRAMEMTKAALESAGHKGELFGTVPRLWQLQKEKRDLRKSHLDHWERTVSKTGTGRPVDAIISPAVAYTAVPHGLNTYVHSLKLGLAPADEMSTEILSIRLYATHWIMHAVSSPLLSSIQSLMSLNHHMSSTTMKIKPFLSYVRLSQ
ncbi:hypothetical protein C0993_011110 [Termitomyces sp. T159_Od127]|nr:hypothetical protein C0993_011110 [Termitomyces sp. T159_Od127]